MPEIKNTFTGGKMNKDLDERLVPSGEYRDAMNVQVSTSDGSDVGAVQNLLGNTQIPSVADPSNFCVGSIPDEKSDSLYWLNAGPPKTNLLEPATQDSGGDNTSTFSPWESYWVGLYGTNGLGGHTPLQLGTTYTTGEGVEFRDTIFEYKDSVTNPIFVDVHTKWFKPSFIRFPSGNMRGDYLILPDNLNTSNGLVPTINGIQVGAKLNFYYYETGVPTNISYLRKVEHFVKEVLPQVDLGTLPNGGGAYAGIIKDVIKIEVPLNPVERVQITNNVNNGKYWFCEIENDRILNFRKEQLITGLNIVDDMLFWTDNLSEPKKINITRSKQGTDPNGLLHTSLVVNDVDKNIPVKLENATVIKKSPTQPPTIELEATTAAFTNSTIMTHAQRHVVDAVTGLPTAGFGSSSGSRDTVIPNGNVFWDWTWDGHGTLPLPGRNIILTFQPSDLDEPNTTQYQKEDPNNPGQLITVGPTAGAFGNIPWKNGANAIGDVVIFRHREDEADYVRCVITEEITSPANNWWGLQPLNVPYAMWSPPFSVDSSGVPTGTISRNDNPYHYVHQRMFRVEILTISQDTPLGWQWYDVRMEDRESNLFERKLPRLALRYRYEDGEYSSFGPFTDAVFSPGSFEYDAKDAANKAMVNNLKRIHVKDLINSETPEDVVQVDIVYKDEDSSNIYLVDNVKPDDVVYIPNTANAWNSPGVFAQGSYTIESESIFTALPSNQLLRPFDNVPRKALAQDVVGNRIVYGNYVQDYNLLDSTENKITPLIVGSVRTRNIPTEIGFGSKSVKSEREYQLGVVYSDEFGRESSVLSSQGSVFEVFKERSDKANQIAAKVENPHPSWATHFKIFVKETTSEYYNLAMDRVYKAEDDGIWMSFPSAERNKIDEETYLILKKPADTNVAVPDVSKYKVVAIENEAPDFIKTSYNSLGEVAGADISTPPANNGADIASLLPAITGSNILQQSIISFNIDKTVWDTETGSALDGSEPYLVSFFEPTTGKQSEKYEVANFTVETDTSATATGNIGVYFFTLKKPITSEDGSWLESTTAGVNVSTIGINIYVKKVDNKPEFDGRFFVKIIRDSLIDTYITTLIQPLTTNYIIDSQTALYWAADADAPVDGGDPAGSIRIGNNSGVALNAPAWASGTGGSRFIVDHYVLNTSGSSQHMNDWRYTAANKGVIGHYDQGLWFIDNVYYAGIQPNNDPNPALAISFDEYPTTFASPYPENYGRGIFEDAGKIYMELSFTVLGENLGFSDLNTVQAWEEAENLDNFQKMISGFKKQDQKFIINGDNTHFKIVDWSMQRRYNHTSLKETNAQDNNSINTSSTDPVVFKHQDATGFMANFQRTFGTQQNKIRFGKAHNRRITFILEIEPVDPNGDDFITYLQSQNINSGNNIGPPIRGTGVDFPIEFISDYVDSESFDLEMSDNPTIWETEPKQKEGLDLYYEATRKFKGVLASDREVQELIPNSQLNPTNFSTMSTSAPNGMLPVVGPNIEVVYSEFRTRFENIGGQPVPESHIRILVTDNTLINLTRGTLGGGQCDNSVPIFNDPNHVTGCWHWGDPGGANPIIAQAVGNGSILTIDLPNGVSIDLELDFNRTQEDWNRNSALAGHYWYFLPTIWNSTIGLSWYNCISFGNGVESDRIRDDFNALQLSNGVKVSRPGEDQYKEQHLKSSLIFSGLYNAKTGINNLNQFIAAEGITKDLNPSYGSVQKLHARDTDLVTLCEDKIIKVLSNKDAVFNADENPQLLATNRVLGQSIPFSGEYGISKDPESFASEAYRAYFTDRQRGKVIRLSRDGITPISDYGMSDYFNDELKVRTTLYGSYDIKRGSYNLTMWVDGEKHHTISFSEKVKGWTSFKSFIPESALSLSGEYYTIKSGLLYQHHVENNTERNTFYGVFTPSTINVLLNANPEIVKNFQTLNYEGSQARIDPFVSGTVNGVTYTDNQYYNLSQKKGWYVEKIKTNCEHGTVNEFIDKECKWFNYIKGSPTSIVSDIDPSQFSFQGISDAATVTVLTASGCTDPNAINYDPQAITNDGSCYYTPGCTDSTAMNFNPSADFDDGSCIAVVLGCLSDPTAINYGGPGSGVVPEVTVDDGSCILPIYGCVDPTAFNYDSNANAPCDGVNPGCDNNTINCTGPGTLPGDCCVAVVLGCTDPNATNYNSGANTDDGSCTYPFYACTDPNATNYNNDPLALACDASGTGPGNNECCTYEGCLVGTMGYSYYPGGAPNADPNASVACSSCCVNCGPLDNIGNDTFDNMQVSFSQQGQGTQLTLSFTNHTDQPVNNNAAVSFNPIVAYRISGSTSTGVPSTPWAFDNTTQTFVDTQAVVVPTTNTFNSVVPHAYNTQIPNLTPGTSYDFAIRLECTRTVWGTGQTGSVYTDWIFGGGLSGITTDYYGCTDPNADGNYDPNANIDDGSCTYNTCTDTATPANNPYEWGGQQYSANTTPHFSGTNIGSWVHDASLCNYDISGCTDICATNYNPTATTNDGSCDYTCSLPTNVTFTSSTVTSNFQSVILTFTPSTYTSTVNPNNPSTEVLVRWRKCTLGQNTGCGSYSSWTGAWPSGSTIGSSFDSTTWYQFEYKTECTSTACNQGAGYYSSTATIDLEMYHGQPPVQHCMDPNAVNTVNTTATPFAPQPQSYINPVAGPLSMCEYTAGCLNSSQGIGNYIGDGINEAFTGCEPPVNPPLSNDGYQPGPPVPLLGSSSSATTGPYDLTGVDTSCCLYTCPETTSVTACDVSPNIYVKYSSLAGSVATTHPFYTLGSGSTGGYNPITGVSGCAGTGDPDCLANQLPTGYDFVVEFSNLIYDPATGQDERIFDGGTGFPANHSTISRVRLFYYIGAPTYRTNWTTGQSRNNFIYLNVGEDLSGPHITCVGDTCYYTLSTNNSEDFKNDDGQTAPNGGAMNVDYTIYNLQIQYICGNHMVPANNTTAVPNSTGSLMHYPNGNMTNLGSCTSLTAGPNNINMIQDSTVYNAFIIPPFGGHVQNGAL